MFLSRQKYYSIYSNIYSTTTKKPLIFRSDSAKAIVAKSLQLRNPISVSNSIFVIFEFMQPAGVWREMRADYKKLQSTTQFTLSQ